MRVILALIMITSAVLLYLAAYWSGRAVGCGNLSDGQGYLLLASLLAAYLAVSACVRKLAQSYREESAK